MLSLHVAGARADDKAAEAQARFAEGVKAYARRDFERARLLFIQSLSLVARGSVLRNLGLVELELGRPVDALHHLRAALELTDLDAKRRSVTENDIRDAYAACGHIAVETTDGATLTVDGETVDGRAPFQAPIDVLPGKHRLEATFAARTARTDVAAPAGEIVTAKLPLEPSTPALTPTPATTQPPTVAPIHSPPPLPELPSPPSSRSPFWSTRREIAAGIAALGIVSTVAGVYFYAQAIDAQNRANAARAGLAPSSCGGPTVPQACSTASDAWSAQSTDAVLNYVFLGVGVASLVAGAAMFVWPEPSSSVTIGPAVTAKGGSLDVRGQF